MEEIISSITIKSESKIVLLVMDGVGGLPQEPGGKTELESAYTPHLDRLAQRGICGLTDPLAPGITPGSGPAHLALFGYDPFNYYIGRGVLEALGIGMELTPIDIAARANYATVDEQGIIVDRRAGRISTERNIELCNLLQQKISRIEDINIIIKPGKEHRFVVVFRGEGLGGGVTETDPQKEGKKPLQAKAVDTDSEKTAAIVNRFIEIAGEILKDSKPANMILMRGISQSPNIPPMQQIYKLNPAAIATYPMYKGLARLVGMKILPIKGETIEDEFIALEEHFSDYDFFFVHIKKTDSSGEDGSFEKKIKAIEEVDRLIPRIEKLNPDVFVVTGDHSTPCLLKSHSWHPNPLLLYSRTCLPDKVNSFGERECNQGGLGRIRAMELMPLILAHAQKIIKFGA